MKRREIHPLRGIAGMDAMQASRGCCEVHAGRHFPILCQPVDGIVADRVRDDGDGHRTMRAGAEPGLGLLDGKGMDAPPLGGILVFDHCEGSLIEPLDVARLTSKANLGGSNAF
jgi:hypothetical protein